MSKRKLVIAYNLDSIVVHSIVSPRSTSLPYRVSKRKLVIAYKQDTMVVHSIVLQRSTWLPYRVSKRKLVITYKLNTSVVHSIMLQRSISFSYRVSKRKLVYNNLKARYYCCTQYCVTKKRQKSIISTVHGSSTIKYDSMR